MVDEPRFELGASSMPRKRASKLRHTPNIQATDDGHLRRMGHAGPCPQREMQTMGRQPLRYLMVCSRSSRRC